MQKKASVVPIDVFLSYYKHLNVLLRIIIVTQIKEEKTIYARSFKKYVPDGEPRLAVYSSAYVCSE